MKNPSLAPTQKPWFRSAAQLGFGLLMSAALSAADTPHASSQLPRRGEPAESVLFIGNSFTFGGGSATRTYRAQTVTDLNHEDIGAVPALFKAFTDEAGLNLAVSLETSGGKGLDWHLQEKSDVIGKSWDHVIMHGYSTLDQKAPGNPALLIRTVKETADLLLSKNPRVDIHLLATWSRADQVYPKEGHWHGQPIEAMGRDVRAAYDQAARGSPAIHSVIPVGDAWNRAFKTGVADPNPYDGIAFGQIDLWTYDHYHGSTFGYYLSALTIFGDFTGLDPRSLGKEERCAFELGLSQAQAVALQQVAFDELSATKGRAPLQTFKPVPLEKREIAH